MYEVFVLSHPVFLGYGTSDQWTRVVDVSMNVLG